MQPEGGSWGGFLPTSLGEEFHGRTTLDANVLAHSRDIRYWTKGFDTLNPHFDIVDSDDLHALSDVLHKRGMYLMLRRHREPP